MEWLKIGSDNSLRFLVASDKRKKYMHYETQSVSEKTNTLPDIEF